MQKKPIILVTVHRRFHELNNTLANINSLKGEFCIEPDIVVLWACPEIGYSWYFQELLKKGEIQHLIYREATEFDNNNGPTTYPASLNIREGLNFIKNNYDFPIYIICNDADIQVEPGIFSLIDGEMQQGRDGFLIFWENSIARENVWHTNFFAVSTNEDYWPPVSSPTNADVLESQWGKALLYGNLGNFVKSHNSRNQKFQHCHISESMQLFPWHPKKSNIGVTLYIMGSKSRWRIIKDFLRRIFYGKDCS